MGSFRAVVRFALVQAGLRVGFGFVLGGASVREPV